MAGNDELLSLGELSPEEREALIEAGELQAPDDDENDGAEDPQAKAAKDALDEDGDGDGDGAADKDDKQQAAGADDDPLGILKEKAQDADGDSPASKPVAAPARADDDDGFILDTRVPAAEVEAHKRRLEEIEAARSALDKELEEGEKSMDEWVRETRKLGTEEVDLRARVINADQQADNYKRAISAQWERAQQRFWAREENNVFDDEILSDALNKQLGILLKQNREAGNPKSAAQVLEDAATELRTKFNLGGAAPKPKAGDQADAAARRKKAAELAKRQADAQGKVPKTLGGLPNADVDAEIDGADEFADLDRLLESQSADDQMEAERIIANMRPDVRRRYERVN